MSLLGYPIGGRQQDLTPGAWAFLSEALPRAEMRRNGTDPDNPEAEEGESQSPQERTPEKRRESASPRKRGRKRGTSELTQAAQARRR